MNEARPKLLIFSHICSPTFVTGAEKLLLLFTREFVLRFQCVLVVPQEGSISQRAKALGVRVVVLDIPLCISLYTAAPTLSDELETMKKHASWAQIHGLLAAERPEYVLVNTSVHPLPAMAAKAMGIPTVWMLMETVMDRPEKHLSISIMTGNSDLIAGISQSTLQPIQELAPQANTALLTPYLIRDDLLPHSWSYHRFRLRQQYGWGEHHRVAGFLAATIYANKGLEHFVNAMLPIAAANPRARFLVLGNSADDSYYRNCQKLAVQAGLSDRFLFLPFAEQIQHAFPVMDVLVVPSLVAEGFGMTALEGLFFGKGVVAYSSGGLTEIMTATGNEEYLVQTGNIGGLTERVNLLLSNEGLLQALGERNMGSAQQAYGADAFRQRLDELIERLPPPSGIQRSSLWRGSAPTVFLVERGIKRPFFSERSFLQRGYLFEQVTDVPDEDLGRLPTGPTIFEIRKGGSRRRKGSSLRRGRRRKRPAGRRRARSRRRIKSRGKAHRGRR
ncbi:glycosyltransferase family 4 protein [Paenibacillaceae bacterium WGS1546]|uniref:glycosyltransferase family 4 protein n=1 Tax=Cohnella sp. WGS1546 TaxID=3366810 RepID=UPI00372D7198